MNYKKKCPLDYNEINANKYQIINCYTEVTENEVDFIFIIFIISIAKNLL